MRILHVLQKQVCTTSRARSIARLPTPHSFTHDHCMRRDETSFSEQGWPHCNCNQPPVRGVEDTFQNSVFFFSRNCFWQGHVNSCPFENKSQALSTVGYTETFSCTVNQAASWPPRGEVERGAFPPLWSLGPAILLLSRTNEACFGGPLPLFHLTCLKREVVSNGHLCFPSQSQTPSPPISIGWQEQKLLRWEKR